MEVRLLLNQIFKLIELLINKSYQKLTFIKGRK